MVFASWTDRPSAERALAPRLPAPTVAALDSGATVPDVLRGWAAQFGPRLGQSASG